MPIRMQNPRYALSSSFEIVLQALYFSSPITSFAYRLVCFTMSSRRSQVNESSKVLIGDSGMSTVGPTGELKGGMVTGVRVEDQEGGEPELELRISVGEGWGGAAP